MWKTGDYGRITFAIPRIIGHANPAIKPSIVPAVTSAM